MAVINNLKKTPAIVALTATLLCGFAMATSCSRQTTGDEDAGAYPGGGNRQTQPNGSGFEDPFRNQGGGQDQGDDQGSFGGNTASFSFVVEEKDFAKYVDPNAALSYTFEYLTVKRDGTIKFENGKAQIRIAGLPVGQQGNLSLTINENGTAALKGVQTGLTLKDGVNQITMRMEPIGGNGGGEELADLTLEIIFETTPNQNGGNGEGNGNSGGGDTGGSQSLAFTDIKSLAETHCAPCHDAANTESYWTARKRALAIRLNTGAAGEMPKPDSPQAKSLSPSDRQRLLDFVLQ